MSKEAMKQWADDVSKAYDILAFGNTERAAEILGKTRDAIRKALAEQHLQDLHDENVRLGLYEQGEPVAWMDVDEKGAASGLRYWSEPDNRHEVALYTTPQQRTWVGLTDEDYQILRGGVVIRGKPVHWMIEHIETKLKEKNNG